MNPRSLFAELKRRKVFRASGAYAIAAFVVLQAVDLAIEPLRLPGWTMALLWVLALAGFPLVLVLAWAFEVTDGGVRRTAHPASDPAAEPGATPAVSSVPAPPPGHRRLMPGIGVGILLALVGFGAYGYFSPNGGSAAGDGAAGGEAGERWVAVLPFTNMSGVPENEYFSDGITEDILTRLSQVAGLRVISRTSVMTYKGSDKPLRQIGEELGVAYILEGSVRRAGDRVRITGQLIDAHTDEHLWAESYDRELTDVFAVQGEIAGEIASALRVRLSAGERSRLGRSATGSVAAYDLYLRGREYFSHGSGSPADYDGNFVSAAALFRQALAEDSTFSPAWAGLARSYRSQEMLSIETRYDSAVAFSNRAIALDPELADGYLELGLAYALRGRNEDASREIGRALELNPNNPDALEAAAGYDYNRGRLDEALRGFKRAAALEPTAFLRHLEVGSTYEVLGDFDQAEAWYRKASAEMSNLGMLECYMGYLAHDRRQPDAAREHNARQLELAPEVPFAWSCAATISLMVGDVDRARELFERYGTEVSEANAPLVELAFLEQRSGKAAAADRLLDRAEARARRWMDERGTAGWNLFELAQIAAVRGDADTAAGHLRAAVAAGYRNFRRVELDPFFDGIRQDPRIRALVAEMQADVDRMRERVRREGW